MNPVNISQLLGPAGQTVVMAAASYKTGQFMTSFLSLTSQRSEKDDYRIVGRQHNSVRTTKRCMGNYFIYFHSEFFVDLISSDSYLELNNRIQTGFVSQLLS